MFTPDEIEKIQKTIDETMDPDPNSNSPERKAALEASSAVTKTTTFINALAVDYPDLHQRVITDSRVKKFREIAFLPKTTGLIFDSPVEPRMQQFGDATRGLVLHFIHPDGDYVIKAYQGPDEKKIAPLAGKLKIGPEQFPSLKHLMTEEYVDGTKSTELDETPKKMTEIGRQLGTHFRTLHQHNIFYNDVINDDFGRSHVIVKPAGDVRLIDFGVSLDVTDPTQFTEKHIYAVLGSMLGTETLAMMDPARRQDLLQSSREKIRKLTSPDFIHGQLDFIKNSLAVLATRIGQKQVEAFWEGFEQAYYAA